MQKQVILSADSPAEMPEHVKRQLDLQTVPLYVNMKDRSLRDGVDVSAEDVFEFYAKEKSVPSTAAVPVGDYEAHFARISEGGTRAVVHFCIGNLISSSYSNACIAARECADICVVDSGSMSVGMSLQLLHAHGMRAQGLSAADIAAEAESYRQRVRTTLLLGSLAFLRKSGRCSAVSALGANLLGIRPVVQMPNGQGVGIYKKLRGRPALVQAQYIDDLLAQPEKIDNTVAFLYHTGMPLEDFYAAEDYVRSFGIFKEIHTGQAGAVTCTHVGERCLALMFAYK